VIRSHFHPRVGVVLVKRIARKRFESFALRRCFFVGLQGLDARSSKLDIAISSFRIRVRWRNLVRTLLSSASPLGESISLELRGMKLFAHSDSLNRLTQRERIRIAPAASSKKWGLHWVRIVQKAVSAFAGALLQWACSTVVIRIQDVDVGLELPVCSTHLCQRI